MRPSALRVALLGRCDAAEVPWVEAALSLLPRTAIVDRADAWQNESLQIAAQSDLCIVFQSWPDEISARTAHALITACAAGRLVCCQGAWCASAGRSRTIWPPALCVFVEHLSSRIEYELAVLAGERPPLPATASRDEAFAAHYELPVGSAAVAVDVESPDPAYARELRRAFDVLEPAAPPKCIVIDVDRCADDTMRRVHSQGAAAVVAVAGFARPELIGELESAGVSATVSKLAPLSELRAACARAVTERSANPD